MSGLMRWFITGVSFDEPVFQKTGDQALVICLGGTLGTAGALLGGTATAEGGPPSSYFF
jgi:hypothetical protein